MPDDERAKDDPAADAGADAVPKNDDPNESTAGLLDEATLREHAHEVDHAIQEAKNRNG